MLRLLTLCLWLSSLLGLWSPLLTPLALKSSPSLAWLLDLASHWQWLYLLLFGISTVFLAKQHKRWLLSLCLLTVPYFTASPRLDLAAETSKPLKILSANVYFENPDLSRLKNLLEQEQPDLIVLVEFTQAHAEQVKTWSAYPYHILQPASDPFGMAILSRLPLSDTETLTDQTGIQHISTQVAYTQPIKLIGFHPIPPMTEALYLNRDTMLQQLTHKPEQATLIAGDFNASPWSSAFQGLATNNFYRTMSLAPTWSSKWYGLIGIPIDQVLASSQWKRVTTKVGTNIGSDHYPVIVELSL